ncbi:hypothetical protein [Bifidobacterium breve]|uniref:hypothetical protein n=1 Tax=Bifidobacterium breve TaxID=1685 RepID=UPI00080BF514|nr:hypothetical protein [Bifidobacterium breve]
MSDKKHGNPLLADRRSHMNSNGFVLGTSGAGKSFNVKAEMADMFLDRTFDKPIVLDPVSLGDRGGESDAFAPAFPSHGDGLGDAYPLSNHLCGILPTVGGECGCLLYRWSDEGTAYKAVLGPQPDQGRPERAVVGEGIWERAVPAMLDFFGQERPDFLCLRLVAHGPADWFERIYTMKSCRTAQQILDSALDAEGGGAMV